MSFDPAAPITPQPPEPGADNMRGLLFMSFGFFLYSVADLVSKLLTESLHPFQIVLARQFGLVLGIAILIVLRGPGLLRTAHRGLQMMRGAVAVVSATCFVFAVRYVPLADAVAVTFIAPFIVTILAALILREPVGMRRWMAVSVGFVGTLIVIRPGLGVFDPAILLAVIAASAFAVRQILSRYLSSTESTATTVAYTTLTATGLTLLTMPFVWISPTTARELLLLAGLAVFAGLGEYMIIRALEIADAVAVAPSQYSLMLWGTIWGWMFYAQLPDYWTWVGAGIIIASGAYTMQREARAARARRLRTPGT